MVRIKPILFNTDMVRAVLDKRKTVTRRICKEGNAYVVPDMSFYDAGKRTYAVHNFADREHTEPICTVECTCPICQGDILYVREKWCKNASFEEYYYSADRKRGVSAPYGLKWRPSIHMPKNAARIWLKVTDVRIERLQDITAAGILAEGVMNSKSNPAMGKRWENMQRMEFEKLWDSTIRKPDLYQYGWKANPWVWVIEFEQCEKPIIEKFN